MRHAVASIVFAATLGLTATGASAGPILTVGGSGANYTTISAAVAYANTHTGDYTIEIAPGTYINDFPVVNAPMTIEAVTPGTVILDATAPPTNGKAIITTNASTTISGLTLENAAVNYATGDNGAGIRDQAGTTQLTIVDSTFKNDQDGILASSDLSDSLSISHSNFISDGFDAGDDSCPAAPDGCDHAVYANDLGNVTITTSVFCGTLVGHDIKSRAASTTIKDNQLYDGAADAAIDCPAGSTSYAIDLPNAGDAKIIGNTIIQGPATQNLTMVSYGEEGKVAGYTNKLNIENNSFTNTAPGDSIGVFNHVADVGAYLLDNTFDGVTTPLKGPGSIVTDTAAVAALDNGASDPVPEPSSLALFLVGLAACAYASRAGRVRPPACRAGSRLR